MKLLELSVFHVEIGFSFEPSLIGLGEQGANQAQARGGVGEDRGDAGTALDFTIDALQAVGRAQAHSMALREFEDGEPFG